MVELRHVSVRKIHSKISISRLHIMATRGHDSWYSNSLCAGWSGVQILVGERDFPFSIPVQIGSFPGIKQPKCGINHPLTSSAIVSRATTPITIYITHGMLWVDLSYYMVTTRCTTIQQQSAEKRYLCVSFSYTETCCRTEITEVNAHTRHINHFIIIIIGSTAPGGP